MKRSFKYKILKYSKFLKKKELKLLSIKAVAMDLRLSSSLRFFFFRFIFNSNITKINYFCVQTSQIRGLVHFFNMFRMNFRKNALFANYSGLKKKSW